MQSFTFDRLIEQVQPAALLFDMDGTLVDNMDCHHETWLKWARAEGIAGTDAEILVRTHGTIGEIVRRFFPHIHHDAELFAIGERKEALYREAYRPHLSLIPGLDKILDAARERGIPMAVATAGDRKNVAFTLDGLEVRSYFRAIVSGEDVTHGKPHPEVFLAAAEKLDVQPERCLVFEDAPAGVEAARRAKMACFVVNQMKPREEFDDCTHVVEFATDYTSLAAEL